MKKSYSVCLAIIMALFLCGCGNSVTGVYQLKWQGYQGENSKTFDFRSDGTCVYTPYLTSYGGESDEHTYTDVDSRSVQGTWAREGGNVVMKRDGVVFATFKREGNDLLSVHDGSRYVKIHQ